MSGSGVPAGIWPANLAAMLLGVLMAAAALTRRRVASVGRGSPGWVVPVGLALLATTLLAPGAEGVHRWLPLGPLRLHAGALVLPPLLVVLAEAPWTVSVATASTALLVLLLQPDAAQAASFCAGWIVLAAARRERGSPGVILASAAVAAASLFRPDPLGSVPHVEGILGLAAAQGQLMAGAGLISLAALPLGFMLFVERPLGLALAAYTAGALGAAWLGNYPVPMLGYGVSPILGYYFAVAAGAAPHPARVPPPEARS
ncbi:MAG TPA: hypothetical protein VLH75_01805 [Longimicrobiales bacterium]|nr:hypothetical protein [Longimicrobiales bacterium]